MSTSAHTTDPALNGYAQGWIERARRRTDHHASWREGILGRMNEVVSLLRDQFGVRRILLFGSFARGDAAPGSDLDLLVDGLAKERLIDATSEVERLLKEVDVDLVPESIAYPAVKARAESEGILLHG